MVKKRLVACLLWRDGLLVQSIGFSHTNFIGNALTAVDFFNTWAIDEIVLLDVSRDTGNRERFHADLLELSRLCFVPLSVGGWITHTDEIRRLLREGADKVVINTHGFRHPEFITEAARIFGNQCIVVSIDTNRSATGVHVYLDRGAQKTDADPATWAAEAARRGAGEIFLTSIDRDGMRGGYDLETLARVSNAVPVPVIASGGVGEWQHLVEGIKTGADAVSAANIFHYSEQSTKKAKEFLKAAGIDVREPEFYKIALSRRPEYRI